MEDYEYLSFDHHNKNEQKNNTLLVSDGYVSELSSFDYLPKSFLGINTTHFGSSDERLFKVHPFLQLKEKVFDTSIPIEDRMQAIRYMSKIPYKNHVEYCVNCIQFIILDETIDPYKRFFFYANNDKYQKLDDHIVYAVHPIFFYYSKQNNYPLELTLLAARYIYANYSYESDERNDVLEFIIDIADDKDETIYARAECADMLYSIGEGDEVFFGRKILDELGNISKENIFNTIYLNEQNVHNEKLNESVQKIIRSLRKEFYNIKQIQTEEYTLETIQNAINNIISPTDNDTREKVKSFFFRIMTDPSKYERLNLADILLLVYHKIQTFDNDTKQICIQRLLEESVESINTCSTGYLSRIINVLSGFVEGEEFSMRIDPKDELRSAVFARVHAKIRSLPDQLRNDILESVSGDDKSMFDEFIEYYSPEEELWNEYKEIMKEEDFKTIYNKCIEEYKAI